MNKKTTNKKNSFGITQTAIIIYLFIGLFFTVKDHSLPRTIFYLFYENTLQFLWNFLLSFIGCIAILRIWIVPIWKFIFSDTQKLGQKIEWYNQDFKHLTPNNKKLFFRRLKVVTFISFNLFILGELTKAKYFLSFSPFYTFSLNTMHIQHYTCTKFFITISLFLIFSVYFWAISLLEGRSRIIARILEKKDKLQSDNLWKSPLPIQPWNKNSDNLELCLFTAFNAENESNFTRETFSEEWVIQKKEGLVANMLGIAPTGAGKTTALIQPSIEQALLWQHQNPEKKASVAVYDPKGELTEYVIQKAEECSRKDDLIVLSLRNENSSNVLHLKNIWDGQTAWRVAGWIISAWLNFQGKSSPEPYWESQNYLLIRSLLILLYVENGENVTLYDVSKSIGPSSSGCYIKQDKIKILTDFGIWVFKAYLITIQKQSDEDDLYELLDEYELPPIKLSLVTPELIKLTEERLKNKKQAFEKHRRQYHSNTNVGLIRMYEEALKTNEQKRINVIREEYKQKLADLTKKDVDEKFKNTAATPQDFAKTHLILSSQNLKKQFETSIEPSESKEVKETAYQIIRDACEWLVKTWSHIPPENRGNIVSNLEPFLKMFETPEVKRALSPTIPTINFDEIITTGSIIVPSFPGIEIGDSLANAIITLIKARWQYAVLANKESKRIKFQIVDEAQRVITFGEGKNAGDFEYMELSRSFGGSTMMVTQSISALRAKAPREADWEKVHGVIRSIICLGTNDLKTIQFIQNIAGKELKQRVSRTVHEGANSPELEIISEKYKGESSSLSVSFTTSETMEDTIQSNDIQGAKAFTGIGVIFDGLSTKILRIALKPTFWPNRRDKWALMEKCNFKPENRPLVTNKSVPDAIKMQISQEEQHEH